MVFCVAALIEVARTLRHRENYFEGNASHLIYLTLYVNAEAHNDLQTPTAELGRTDPELCSESSSWPARAATMWHNALAHQQARTSYAALAF